MTKCGMGSHKPRRAPIADEAQAANMLPLMAAKARRQCAAWGCSPYLLLNGMLCERNSADMYSVGMMIAIPALYAMARSV